MISKINIKAKNVSSEHMADLCCYIHWMSMNKILYFSLQLLALRLFLDTKC